MKKGSNNNNKKKKDIWEKMHDIGPLVSGVLIALIGAIFTHSFREREMAISEMSTFQAYISNLKDSSERPIALILIEHFGDKELAMKLVETGEPGTEKYGDAAMQTTVPAEQAKLPKDTIEAVPKDTTVQPHFTVVSKSGWVYLGDYSSETKKWRTRYFDVSIVTNPYTLMDSTLRVTTEAVNVRDKVPTQAGTFGQVIGVLKRNSQVKIKDVKAWQSTGYMWAWIEYAKVEVKTE